MHLNQSGSHRQGLPRRSLFILSSFLGICFLFSLTGCGPAASPPAGESPAASNDNLEITDETVRERINGVHIRNIPEETGAAEPAGWTFDEDEPKEITIVDRQIEGTRATLVLDIKTSTAPHGRSPRSLAGQIRTEWQLETGWVLRRWEIVDAENISMKYKKLPKPPAPNTNDNSTQ